MVHVLCPSLNTMPVARALARVAAAAALGSTLGEAGGNRLRITNGCSLAPLWIAHEAGAAVGPDPQNVRIEPLQFHDFETGDGLKSTRYWPKMACDEQGNNCGLGGSGGPQELCVGTGDYKRCAPPIDTKFEASFGVTGQPCNPATNQMQGCDYVDVSLVDGWTLPFRLELQGECEGKGGDAPPVIDCSGLTFDMCPSAEMLTTIGATVNLQAVNPRTDTVTGCYSPCSKLIDLKWHNSLAAGRKAQDPEVAPYCCPTPPESPEACRAGPVKDTAYVKAMHRLCPGVYGYSYDDARGLLRCSSVTIYNLIFKCPAVIPPSPTEKPALLPEGPGLNWKLIVGALLVLLAIALLVSRLLPIFSGQPQHPPLPMAQMQVPGPGGPAFYPGR
mmetsp:Transcript_12046/g.28279  ORF Transcript_12046/g.28279 Transcript_12046/m.28279 type:complete len:388 (-) Transcript_12046:64-1227(-)